MTENEADAGVGRLTRRYAETKRKIACIRGRLDEVHEAAEEASRALRYTHAGDHAKLKSEFDAVPWSDISEWLGALAKLEDEQGRIEGCLREAGLGDLIR